MKIYRTDRSFNWSILGSTEWKYAQSYIIQAEFTLIYNELIDYQQNWSKLILKQTARHTVSLNNVPVSLNSTPVRKIRAPLSFNSTDSTGVRLSIIVRVTRYIFKTIRYPDSRYTDTRFTTDIIKPDKFRDPWSLL